jgi:cob(I)alamin adenosyltransferase
METMKGYVQLYTGNGKGKTTAALGLALRAVGAGRKVFFAQFVKGKSYSENETIERMVPGITVRQYGRGCFIVNAPEEEDIRAAGSGLKEVDKIIRSGDYGLVVLDEACIAVYYNLFTEEALIGVMDKRCPGTEIVVTGRYATRGLIDYADLVTEMKEVKHYYTRGVQARKGIEY